VLVVLGGDRWDYLPPTFHGLPGPTRPVMARVRFWYPASIQELLALTCEDPPIADTVILVDAHQLVEKAVEDEMLGNNKDKSFVQAFARLSAVLLSFVTFCLVTPGCEFETGKSPLKCLSCL
jgi:hypothetical protein